MEHSLSRPPVAPHWRTATIVAGAVAAAEFAALLAIGLPMLGRSVSTHVRTAAEERVFAPAQEQKQAKEPITLPALPRRKTAVVVLNGSGLSGAAAGAGRQVHGLGYVVAGVGNAPRSTYGRTIVMYRPGRKAEAERLARDIGVQLVGPLDGLRKRDLVGAHVALVLGSD
jgi:hypothetical protein